jgi:hypothetical protein
MRSGNRHKLRLLFWMLLSAAPLTVWSQVTFRETEDRTYNYFIRQEWDSLITAGHKAIRHDIDYYFLRARMGIAYDARGQFIRSAWQYDKALGFNAGDPFAVEKRYFALKNSNRLVDARAIQALMTREQRERLCEKSPVLNYVSLDLGYTVSNAYNKINTSDLTGPDSLYGEADLYGDDYFANLGMGFNLSDRITLLAGYSYLNFAKRKTIQYGYAEDRLDSTLNYEWGYNNFYSFPRVTGDYPFDYSVAQHEFCVGGIVALGHGVKIMPSFRLVSVKYNNIHANYSSAKVMDTSYYVIGTDTYYTFPFTRSHYSVTNEDTSFFNCLISLAATRDFDFLTIGMSGSWSNLNGGDQLQASGFVTWYPLGNLGLYGTTGVTMVSESGDGRMLYSQMVGGKIVRWLWAEGDFIWGDLSNSNTANGWVVYNNTGKIKYRAGATLILTIIRNLDFTFNYQFFEKESPVYHYALTDSGTANAPVMKTSWNRYQAHNMFIGIRVRI